MKIKFLIILSICSFSTVYASDQYAGQANQRLSEYFAKDIAADERVKNTRTIVLVAAADDLHEGITREKFKIVRSRLASVLLPCSANQEIVDCMNSIKKNHARKISSFYCKPWVLQSTINREAKELRNLIDATLKKENSDAYATLKQYTNKSVLLEIVQAHPVVVPTAPLSSDRLVQRYSNK